MVDRAGNGTTDSAPPSNDAPGGTSGGASAQPPPADDGLDLKARLDRFGEALDRKQQARASAPEEEP